MNPGTHVARMDLRRQRHRDYIPGVFTISRNSRPVSIAVTCATRCFAVEETLSWSLSSIEWASKALPLQPCGFQHFQELPPGEHCRDVRHQLAFTVVKEALGQSFH